MLNWNIDPVLLELGPLEIRYYGVLFALGLFGAYSVGRQLCKKKKLSLEILDTLGVYLIVGLIVGARFGHIVFYELDYYLAHPELILQVWRGGLASHGAAIGVLIAYALFLWRNKKVKFFDYADIMAVGAAIPASTIRLGNFFNSEIVGRATGSDWGVVFERVDDTVRHPSQLYEFGMGAILFVILYTLWLKYNKKAKPGFFFGLFFTIYFAMRFTVEFFKEYPLHDAWFNLTTGQLLSIPFFLLGVGVLGWSQKKAKL
jgi:phosphatidylglycerol:prolipoprotein diacylglycerol transferase